MEELTKWQKFKKYWKDPKTHALICFGIYGIFFLIVFIIMKFSQSSYNVSEDNNVDPFTYYSEMKSYEYDYSFSFNENFTTLNGIVYNQKEKITIKETKEKFYFDDSVPLEYDEKYLNLENKIKMNLAQLKPNILKEYIAKYNTKDITTYKDGSSLEEYIIDVINLKEMFTEDIENSITGLVYIKIYIDNDTINKITIDLGQTNLFDNYQISLEYKNINNISDFTVSY